MLASLRLLRSASPLLASSSSSSLSSLSSSLTSSFSTSAEAPVVLRRDAERQIAHVDFARPSLSLEVLRGLKEVLDEVKGDKEIRGVVLGSTSTAIFNAGLDISEFLQEEERLRAFWGSLQDAVLALYNLPKPTVAAIVGHAPAGGCAMAMATDYRVMSAGLGRIGLNETQLGIVAPYWFGDLMVRTVGHRQAELHLGLGSLLSPEDALAINLVDEIIEADKVREKAVEVLAKLIAVPAGPYAASKATLRTPVMAGLAANKEADIDNFVTVIRDPRVQQGLKMAVEALKNKNKKSKM